MGAMLSFVRPPSALGWLTGLTVISSIVLPAGILALLFRRYPARVQHGVSALHLVCFVGGLAPVVLLFAWAIRNGVQTRDLTVAGLFAFLVVVLGLASDRLYAGKGADVGNEPRDSTGIGAAAFASGAALALGLAIAFALPGLWMAVGFAIAALAVAVLDDRRPLPALRRVAAALATIAVLRGITSPALFGAEAWPILNLYLVAYGLPAAALSTAAFVMVRKGHDRNVRVLEGASLIAFAALVFIEIRHAVHGVALLTPTVAQVLSITPGFHETWLFVLAGTGFTAIGVWLQKRVE